MDTARLQRVSEYAWRVEPRDGMHVPAVIYADAALLEGMDDKVCDQLANVTRLPGIVSAGYAMPDAHWGYGFPVGGVAAFDPAEGGVVSAGGVGFDISCGVRTLHTGLRRVDIAGQEQSLARSLFRKVPVGVGSRGSIRLDEAGMDAMLAGGASWAVECGWGRPEDLGRIEENGRMEGAEPKHVSAKARQRQRDEMGTLGSGNHYLEVQEVGQVLDGETARSFGIAEGDLLVTIHCGSRGLGHQVGTEFLKEMVEAAPRHGIRLPDRELACAPIDSEIGRRYLGVMRAAINCALANRQIITHLAREVFARLLPQAELDLIYDVSHNTCKVESHEVDGRRRRLYVHRKGATRAFGPGHEDLPAVYRESGQPVLIGGSMGTSSWILAGNAQSGQLSFSSACHGAGRAMSRRQATKRWRGRDVVDELARRGIVVMSPSQRGVAEEAPGAYKDVDGVVEATERAGLARRVARLRPVVCVKG